MFRSSRVTVFFLILGIVAVVVHAASLTISNASFETATLPINGGNGPFSNVLVGSTLGVGGTLANWTASSTTTSAAAGGFAPTIGGSNWTSKWWTGSNIAYLQTNAVGSVALSQALSDTLQNNTTYTLSSKVGKRSLAATLNYSLQLWAGSTLLSSSSTLPLATNTSNTDRLVYSSGPSNPAAGQPLKIVLSSTWVAGLTEAFFDDISLSTAASSLTTLVSSPPSTAQLGQSVTLTATVSPSSATGTVTFYDRETVLGIATVAGGQASLSTTLLRSGQRSFKAYYSGDAATGPSSSISSTFTVNAATVGRFATATTSTTLQGPSDLTIGDFNGDGKADLAVSDYSANKVSILLGVGDGTFASHVDYDAGTQPVGIAAGDFNGDGKTDLVIADNGTGSLRILFGSGTGTFGSPLNPPVGSTPQGVAVGDFNLDGKADIVAANYGSNSVTVLIGNGDGTFQTGVAFPAGTGPRGVAIGDFNGDGIPDLAVANNVAGTVGILLGIGNGGFQPVASFNAGNPFYLAVADMNGDGREDVVASNLNLSNNSGNTVSVLLSNSNGTLQPYQSYGTGLSSTGIRGLAVGDFNGDGRPDVVLANWQSTAVSLMVNNGSGALGNPMSITVGQGPSDVVIGDLNGDGLPDIAAALFNGGGGSSASVALGRTPPPADLLPQNITLGSSAIAPGASLAVNWTLANIGTAAANASSTTVVRINQSPASPAGTDLASISTAALAAGASAAQNTTLTAPTTPGIYYVWVMADRFGVVDQNTFNDAQRSGVLIVTTEPDHWIYTDLLVNGWNNCSWASVNFNISSPVHSGGKSFSVNAGPNQALCIAHNDYNFDANTLDALTFWIHGGSSGGQIIGVRALLVNDPQAQLVLPPLVANTWQQITIPLSSLGVANQPNLNGFVFENTTGNTLPAFYVDDMKLTPAPAPALVHLSANAGSVIRVAGRVGVNAAIWDNVFDTSTTISMLTDVNNQAFRFPGGSLSDDYHWSTNKTNNGTTWANSFTSFAHVATNTPAADVFITANYGTGTATEAAAWVTNANVTHTYGFKYWEVGNENYGSWETDTNARPHDPYTYALRFKDYFNQMKAADPTIKVGAVVINGEDNYANYTDHPATNPRTTQMHNGWTPVLLATLKSLGVTPDFIAYHRYEQQPGNESDAYLLQAAHTWHDDASDLRQQLIDYLGSAAASGVEIVCTEHNSVAYNVGKQTTSLINGLFMADSIGQVLQTEFRSVVWWDMRNDVESTNNNSSLLYGWRQYGDYGYANYANPAGAADRYPAFYAAKLLSHFARGGDQIVNASTDYSLLSFYAAKRSDGSLSLLVINKSPNNVLPAAIDVSSFTSYANTLVYTYGLLQDDAARTGIGTADLAQTSLGGVTGNFTYTFAPYSATVISLVQSSPKKQGNQLTSQ